MTAITTLNSAPSPPFGGAGVIPSPNVPSPAKATSGASVPRGGSGSMQAGSAVMDVEVVLDSATRTFVSRFAWRDGVVEFQVPSRYVIENYIKANYLKADAQGRVESGNPGENGSVVNADRATTESGQAGPSRSNASTAASVTQSFDGSEGKQASDVQGSGSPAFDAAASRVATSVFV